MPRLKSFAAFAILALVSAIGSSPVAGAPIGSASGVYVLTPPFTAASGPLVPFSGGILAATSSPLTPLPLSGSGSYSVSDITIDLTGFTTNPGNVTITDPLVITEFGTGFTAVFSVAGPGALTAGTSSGTVDFGFTLALTSNATSIDFGNVGGLWRYIFSYQGLTIVVPGQFSVEGGAQGTSTASFTLIRDDLLGGGLPVPEPTTLVGWSVIITAGLVFRKRLGTRSAR